MDSCQWRWHIHPWPNRLRLWKNILGLCWVTMLGTRANSWLTSVFGEFIEDFLWTLFCHFKFSVQKYFWMNLDCLWCWFYTGRPLFAQIISSSYSPARFCIFICIWIWMPTINHCISQVLLQYKSMSIISRAIWRCHFYPICIKLCICGSPSADGPVQVQKFHNKVDFLCGRSLFHVVLIFSITRIIIKGKFFKWYLRITTCYH